MERSLRCPTQNVWIKDEVALWLTLARMPQVRVGLFSRHDVLQGPEYQQVGLSTHLVAHYFSVNEESFRAWLAQLGARAEPAPEPAASSPAQVARAFEQLGARLEEAWERVDFDEQPFPALAVAALREARLERAMGSLDVARWALEAPRLPQQDDLDANFGDPPLTVFRGRRFYIQVLLWREGRTAIHRHGFSGAFLVLDGASLHVRYTFDVRRRVSSRLLLGDLRPAGVELLARGEVVPITCELAHAVFHLEAPAATVVIRTFHEDAGQPQYSFRPPFVAYDPFHREPQATRQLQVLRLLWDTRPAEGDALAEALVARADLLTTWLVVGEAQQGPRAARLLAAARRRHGRTIDELAAVVAEDCRRADLGRLRKKTLDPEQRFFLALLQNVPHRAGIEAMIRQRHPHDAPRARILGWLQALSGVDAIGVDSRGRAHPRRRRRAPRRALHGRRARGPRRGLRSRAD